MQEPAGGACLRWGKTVWVWDMLPWRGADTQVERRQTGRDVDPGSRVPSAVDVSWHEEGEEDVIQLRRRLRVPNFGWQFEDAERREGRQEWDATCCKTVVLKLQRASESPRGLAQTTRWALRKVSDSGDLEHGLGFTFLTSSQAPVWDHTSKTPGVWEEVWAPDSGEPASGFQHCQIT